MRFGKLHILWRVHWLLCDRRRRTDDFVHWPEHIVKIHHKKLWCKKCLRKFEEMKK